MNVLNWPTVLLVNKNKSMMMLIKSEDMIPRRKLFDLCLRSYSNCLSEKQSKKDKMKKSKGTFSFEHWIIKFDRGEDLMSSEKRGLTF